MVAEKKHRLAMASRVLNNGVARAWNQWFGVYEEMRRLRKFGKRVLNQARAVADGSRRRP